MDSKNFIYTELSLFVKRFAKARVRYEYDQNALVHTIEVLPNEIYNLDKDYIEWENDFFGRFVKLFPTENICFISDDAQVGINIPELVLAGMEYDSSDSLSTAKILFSTKKSKCISETKKIRKTFVKKTAVANISQ